MIIIIPCNVYLFFFSSIVLTLINLYLFHVYRYPYTKHISGIRDFSYSKHLDTLKLYSLQRRRDRYSIIYVWKIVEGLVPNLSDPITCSLSDRRGRTCIVYHAGVGRLGTLKYHFSGGLLSISSKCLTLLHYCIFELFIF